MKIKINSARFNTQPVISINADGSCVVKEDFKVTYCWETKEYPDRPKGFLAEVRSTFPIDKGFTCDGASIVPILRGFVSKYNATNAGIVHDYMYKHPVQPSYLSRKSADRVFYLLLQHTKMNAVSCFLAYVAVRLFGGRFYNAGKKSALEEQFARCLRADGIEFEREFHFDKPNTRRRADFLIKPNILVECQGLVFRGKGAHSTPTGIANDYARHNDMVRLGYTPLYVTNIGRGNTEPAAVSLLVKQLLGV